MKRYNPAKALRRFGFMQTVRGALIISILGGLMMGAYGTAIAELYPSEKSRQELVQTLKSAPAVNFLSGEVKNAGTPASYSIYKSLPMMVLLTSIWGLMVATRLLRGAEEDGRLEALVGGAITRRQAAMWQLAGFGYALALAVIVMWAIIAALGAAPGVDLSVAEAFYMTLAVFLPGLVFAGAGVLTSQLALTRSRAVLYGLVPLLVFYCIRGIANTSDQLDWLKSLSPFGWSDLMDPVLNPQMTWVIPSILSAGLFAVTGLFLISRRDYGMSLFSQQGEVRSRFYLLSSTFAFALRQKKIAFIWWLVAAVSTTLFMTALAGLVSDLIHDNSSLGGFLALPSDKIKLLFIGESFMILSLILLAMMVVEVAAIRRDEAKAYLDNLLVQPVRRQVWLSGRLLLACGMALLITTISSLAAWGMAEMQQIDISILSAINSGIAVASGIIFIVGVGAFLYGIWPRLGVIGMTVVVGWAFVVDLLKSFFHLQDWVSKTSILYYIPVDPSKSPEWAGIIWLTSIGILLGLIGIIAFTRRDIISE